MKTPITIITTITLALLMAVGYSGDASARKQGSAPTASEQTSSKKGKKASSKSGKKQSGKQSGKKSGKKSGRKSGKHSGKKSSGSGQMTSADVQRQQNEVQRDIQRTEASIRENDAAVSRNLTALGKLQGDIEVGQKRVSETKAKADAIGGQISRLQSQISAAEAQLAGMRAEYLRAVKKMRATRQGRSALSFIFSSGNFREAMHRVRSLRQFAAWRDRRSEDIRGKVTDLKRRQTALSQARTMQINALRQQEKAQSDLRAQYGRQDALVASLKANGTALRSHLASRQAEANRLRGQVASLIASEQAARERAAREQAAREEAARQQAAREQTAREQTAREQAAREQAVREQENLAMNEQPAPAETRASSKTKTKTKAKKKTKTETATASAAVGSAGNSYAQARRRKPRKSAPAAASAPAKSEAGTANAPTAATQRTKVPKGAENFEGMKGRLPRPVAGGFKVTSRFGRHALPDMPNVVYDNPGIDAECAVGAAAQAVYAGKVSGVYVVPGYNTVVIVNHGNYYTVYGNIASVSVKVGDSVSQGQKLGAVAAEEGNPSQGSIHFEVWKNRDKQDPMAWIR